MFESAAVVPVQSIDVVPYDHLLHYNAIRALLRGAGWTDESLPPKNAFLASIAYVALSNATPIGFVRIITDWITVSYVCEIAVAPEYKRRGIGNLLLDKCSWRFSSTRIDLLSSASATEFYEHSGFTAKPGYRRWPK